MATSNTDISKTVLCCINIIIQNQQKKKLNWSTNSTYEPLRTMSSIDDKGDVGEMLLNEVLKNKFDVVWEKAITRKEKDWDILVDGIKIEVKTATMGNSSIMFQHEKFFKNRKYDVIAFLDFAPDELYVTLAKKSDIIWEKLHKRTVDGVPTTEYKFDFSLKNIKEMKIDKLKRYKIKLIKTEDDLMDLFQEFIRDIWNS